MARSDPEAAVTALELAQAMKLAGAVVERRSTVPVLSCVRLTAERSGVSVEATDLDIQITIRTAATLPGKMTAVVLSHRSLAEALKRTDGSLSVGGQDKRFTVGDNPSVSLAANEYDWPRSRVMPVETALFEYPAADLADDLAVVALAMSSEETRYYLNGVLMHVTDGQLRLAATDGRRLHRVSRPLPEIGRAELKESIIPRKAIAVIRAALAAQAGVKNVSIEVAALAARFTIGAVVVTTRLIDGTFPDYRRIISDKFAGGMLLDPRELTRPSTLVTRLMQDRGQWIAVRPADGTLHSKSADGIQVNARIERELVGDAIEQIGFRAQYLIDAMMPFLGQRVTMSFNGSADPAQISGSDPRLLVILMPMRI